jgi:hypothetical protein
MAHSATCLLIAGFLLDLLFDHEDKGRSQQTSTRLHGMTFLKTVIFTVTTTRISNPTYCYMLRVRDHFWPSNVPCLPLLDVKCNPLGYRRHYSICYTCLFTTPLVITIISFYIVLWPSDVVSRSSTLISSLFSSMSSVFYLSAPKCWQLAVN